MPLKYCWIDLENVYVLDVCLMALNDHWIFLITKCYRNPTVFVANPTNDIIHSLRMSTKI
jgi:hypothetical protein